MDLSQKIGPFPAYVWGGIFGLLVVGALYWQNMNGGGGTGETPEETENASATDTDAIDGAFEPGTANGSPTAAASPETVDTNEAWLLRAVAYLVGKGNSPLTAQRALSKYLNGTALNAAEEKLVNLAIAGTSSPPETVEIAAPIVAPTLTIKRWKRLHNGAIMKVMSNGTEVKVTPGAYITAGMPRFSSNAYETKIYTVKASKETAAQIASKYKTSTENLQIINRWKSIPDFKKGSKVKVPVS